MNGFLTLKHVDRPAVLLAVVTNLLDARSDVEVQRLWITAAQEMVGFYYQYSEVFWRSYLILARSDTVV